MTPHAIIRSFLASITVTGLWANETCTACCIRLDVKKYIVPSGQTETITPIEQYRRTLLNLPGGNPTTYQVTTGIPLISLTQWRLAMYVGDILKVSSRITLFGGFRYQFQTTPVSATNFAPRVGLSWSADKKNNWVLHARAGLFHDTNIPFYATNVYRLDGIHQQQRTIYSPDFESPLTTTPGSIDVRSIYRFPSSLRELSSLQTHVSIEHKLPKGWHAASTLYWAENWGSLRLRNINAPLIADSNNTATSPDAALQAPRPFAPNENIFEYQNSGHLSGNILVAGADNHSNSRFGVSAVCYWNPGQEPFRHRMCMLH